MLAASLKSDFKSPLQVTVAYFVMYYVFLYIQSGVGQVQYYLAKRKAAEEAKARGEKPPKISFAKVKYDSASYDKVAIMSSRTVGNTMEQAFPFLTALWLHALFVSPESAGYIGWIYVCTRAYYPVVFYFGLPYILLSTLPGYACVFYMLYSLL